MGERLAKRLKDMKLRYFVMFVFMALLVLQCVGMRLILLGLNIFMICV